MDAEHGCVNESDFLSICSQDPAVESNAEGVWVNKNEYLLSCSREYGIEVDAGHGAVNEEEIFKHLFTGTHSRELCSRGMGE